MSAEQLEQAIWRLCETADALEAGAASRPSRRAAPAQMTIEHASPGPSVPTARIVVSALAHAAVSVAALGALFALGDPLLPRPDGPTLERSVAVDVHDQVHARIPHLGANQP